MKRSLALLLIHATALFGVSPIVSVNLPGLLGNRLFAFCVGKIIAENLGLEMHSEPIWGFPNTYCYLENVPCSRFPTEILHDESISHLNLQPIFQNRPLCNIQLDGYFQSYQWLKPHTQKIRQDWLKIDPSLLLPRNTRDVVVHVRAQYPNVFYIPFSYYEKALSLTTYERVFICTDDPNHPFLKNFEPYQPIIVSTRNLEQVMHQGVSWPEISKINFDDFLFIHSFDKIICSFSTYSWWAAFLSDAQEIYAPLPTDPSRQYLKVDEPRYHYLEVNMGS